MKKEYSTPVMKTVRMHRSSGMIAGSSPYIERVNDEEADDDYEVL